MSATQISPTTLEATIASTAGVLVVDLFASWCAPCKSYAPQFEQAAGYFSPNEPVKFIKVDVDENQDKEAVMAALNLRSIPTTLFFVNGELRTRRQGIVAASELATVVSGLQTELA